jgi:hypothetical protein
MFFNSIVFTSFCLQTSELNEVLNFAIFSHFLIGMIGGRLVFGLLRILYAIHTSCVIYDYIYLNFRQHNNLMVYNKLSTNSTHCTIRFCVICHIFTHDMFRSNTGSSSGASSVVELSVSYGL